MSLETLHEVKQTSCKRTNIVQFHLNGVPQIGKFIEYKSRTAIYLGLEVRENAELLFKEYRISVGHDEKVLEMDGGSDAKQCECP